MLRTLLALIPALVAVACARPATHAVPNVAIATAEAPFDMVISGGRIVDGSGNPWYYGDLGIREARIARITPPGMLASAHAFHRIDARGLVVAPGFIDIQGQSAEPLTLGDGRVVSKVTQGVTTEILGEGDTPAPSNGELIAAAGIDTPMGRAMLDFTSTHGFGRWLETMVRRGSSVNVGSFLGAATIRTYAKGRAEGAPTAAELDTMRTITRDAMRDGAFGVASALIYPPGSYAGTAELIEIARAMAPFGGLYITHMRSEGDRYLEAIDEALRIGKDGGVPVEIYHLKAAGVRNWGKGAPAIARIDSARAAGQDVGADMYPYVAGATSLAACVPPWAAAEGKLLENVRNPALRARIVREIEMPNEAWENLCALATPEGVMLVGFTAPSLRAYEGLRLAEVAAREGKGWAETLLDLIVRDEGRTGMVAFLMSEDNVALQMRQPWMKFGTDAGGWDPNSAKELTHPRAYGTYPRILGRYVREARVLTLEEAVRKMTSAVANRLSIRDRGLLREGMFADVVLFDPATIIDRATYDRPHQLSSGVTHVFVNGIQVVSDGEPTGRTPGRVVRGPGWSGWGQGGAR